MGKFKVTYDTKHTVWHRAIVDEVEADDLETAQKLVQEQADGIEDHGLDIETFWLYDTCEDLTRSGNVVLANMDLLIDSPKIALVDQEDPTYNVEDFPNKLNFEVKEE